MREVPSRTLISLANKRVVLKSFRDQLSAGGKIPLRISYEVNYKSPRAKNDIRDSSVAREAHNETRDRSRSANSNDAKSDEKSPGFISKK